MNDDDLRSAFDDLVHDLPGDRALPVATARRAARRRGLKLGATALGGVGALGVAAALVLGSTAPSDDRLVIPAERPTAAPSASAVPSARPSPERSPATSPSPAPSPTAVPNPGPTGPSPVTPSSEPSTPVRVVLRPDGLGFTDGGSSTSALAFGTDAATVRTALDDALGEGGAMATPDCGQGSVTVQYERLFVLEQDGELVGWVTGSPGLTTADGIGVGSTLAELRGAFASVTVTETTLGAEWSTGDGGLAGFLDGTQDSSVVNNMAAGARCLAR